MREPSSMDECVYFTNRSIDAGKIRAWVLREQCTKCAKGLMGKPKNEKTGKAKIRALEYSCPECHYTLSEEAYEDTLSANIQYTCGKCNTSDELQLPFKRKKVKRYDQEKGKDTLVEAIMFPCKKCNEKIYITKKMK